MYKIYYIFYYYLKNEFLDNKGTKIFNLNIRVPEINDSNLDYSLINAISNFNKSKIIMKNAIKKI